MSKANKLPLKKNASGVIQPIEIKNHYLPLETEERTTENKNTRTDSPNTEITAKQNAIKQKRLMKTGIIVRSKGLFVLNYSTRPKKSDNKKFWKTIKAFFFSNKGLNMNNIMLIENNEIEREEKIIANIMNNYFANITTHL